MESEVLSFRLTNEFIKTVNFLSSVPSTARLWISPLDHGDQTREVKIVASAETLAEWLDYVSLRQDLPVMSLSKKDPTTVKEKEDAPEERYV